MLSPKYGLLLLFLVFAVEFLLFDQFGSRRVTPIFPRWNDQIQYLSEAYTAHEYARSHGVGAALWHTLTNPSAQGTLHDVAGVIMFELVRPSRSAALALNMLALIAWQAALYAAVRRRGAPPLLAVAAAMLPLALQGPWLNLPGAAYDFRLDHFAMCALGMTTAAALATDGLRSRSGSIAFGVATGITLLTRFITGTYFVVIFAALLVWAITSGERRRRVTNVCIAALIAAAIALPIFWINREWVWNYYYIGHYVGPESAIRNQNFGLGKSLSFVWSIFASRHLGAFFGVLAVGMAAALACVRFATGKVAGDRAVGSGERRGPAADIVVFGGIFLLAPAVVLTLHPQKSDVVLNALAPGAVLLVTAVWLALARPAAALGTLAGRWVTAAAVIVTVTTVSYFALRQFTPADDPGVIANLRTVNTAADHIFARSQAAGLKRPRVAVDYITDALDAQVLRVICYERHRVWIDFDMKLPTGIAEPDAALVRQRLAESDFAFIIADDAPFGSFPYDRKLLEMRPELRAWCEANLVPGMRFTFWGHPITLYQRPEL